MTFVVIGLAALVAVAVAGDDERMILLASESIDTRVRDSLASTPPPPSLLNRVMSFLSSSSSHSSFDETIDAPPELVFVHLHRAPLSAERASLEAELGVPLTHYVPFNTFLVSLSTRGIATAAAHPLVAWVGRVEPAHKVHGSLLEHVWRMTVGRTDACQWNVQLVGAAHSAAVRLLVAEAGVAGVRVVDEHDDGARLIVDVPAVEVREARRLLAALVESERVFAVERRLRYGAKNKYATWLAQSGVKDKRTMWEHGIRGEGQVVGCADSGLDVDHCFFADPSQPAFSAGSQKNPNHRKVLAYFAFKGADYTDDVGGHGTHVVGSIAGNAKQPANPTEERVIGESNGAAPEAKVVFHDIGVTGGGLTVDSDVMDKQILQPAYDLGARVHTNSWGCSGDPSVCNQYDAGARAVDDFVWKNRDMLVLFAAGNDGQNAAAMTQTVGSPATAKSAFVVGAQQSTYESWEEALTFFDWAERKQQAEEALKTSNLDCCNPPSGTNQRAIRKFCCAEEAKNALIEEREHLGENSVADFSSRGPTYDGRIKPEIMAPGQHIVSSHSDGKATPGGHCGLQAPSLGNNAARLAMQGTSMATPHAAGNAALVRQYFTEGWYPSGRKTPADAMARPSGALIRAAMIASTVELTGKIDKGNNGTWTTVDPIWPTYSIYQGFGALRLGSALKFADESTHNLYVDDVWPGGHNGGGVGIDSNQTQLYCLTPKSSKKIRAVLVYDDYPSAANAQIGIVNNLDLLVGHDDTDKVSGNFKVRRDARNTAEHAFFEQPAIGKKLFVQVRAFGVPQGPQPFAVVIVGDFDKVDKGAACGTDDPFPTVQAEATDADYFPAGVAIGATVAGATLVMVLLAVVRAILKAKGMA